mmetsp:Transcript_22596/g.56515  ORF Transcript_22596/g.56515 Transcript_22596/m.56515 type:complete len:428 (+) Transcript_22596:51-1334(+)|eukprot:CAMPEP_0173420200 /NCGR_PEP_ID=MMETSP1357-20121228/1787_1 /TAXON_ID=77926 /ORGANISM="Hemiselmis rufescens, Strain PCC563" /LENGTH=427 /DNA_ID=CAMNT_0014382967 /DNA_START=51 /DNA_END=1334 /DNA_ORIENTATION=-
MMSRSPSKSPASARSVTASSNKQIDDLKKKVMELTEENLQLKAEVKKANDANPVVAMRRMITLQSSAERRTLGTAKYRVTSVMSIDMLWLLSFGFSAELIANIYVPALIGHLGLADALDWFLPARVDLCLTLLNLSGAFIEGMAIHCERKYVRFQNPPILVVFRGGFIAIYTSLAGLTQHGADLELLGAGTGALYVALMVVAGLVSNILGMLFLELVARTYLATHRPGSAKGGVRVIDLAATVYDDLLFNLVYMFIGVTVFLVYTNQFEYDSQDVLWGLVYVVCATCIGGIVAGSAQHDGVQWGTFKCNSVACIVMACSLVLGGGRFGTNLTGIPAFEKMIATFCGGLSAFNATTSDTIQLWRLGRKSSSVYNLLVNIGVMAIIVVLLSQHHSHMAIINAVPAPKKGNLLVKIFGPTLFRRSPALEL